MKKVLALMFMAVVMLSVTVTANAATKRVQATGDVNLRKGPGLKYAVTTSVKKGTVLTYAGSTKKDSRKVKWYKVSYKNKKVWISSKYSKLTTNTSKKIKATGNVNLRKGPGLNYGEYTSVKKGTTLTYLNKTISDDRGVNWHNVSYKGKSLWISSRYSVMVK